jgi:hypothetical protein
MENLLKILPLAALLIVAVIGVWRGFARKPDSTANRAKGGGPKWDYWRD